MERLLASKTLYQGKILSLAQQTVQLDDDTQALREVVHTSGSAAVLALALDGRALFVRQWRTPLKQETLEVPAGRIEAGESGQQTAIRELNEEVGMAATQWQKASAFYQAAGFSDARCQLFIAQGLTPVADKRPQDVGEAVQGQWLTLAEAQAQVAAGVICDAKSVIAVLLWENRRLKGTMNG